MSSQVTRERIAEFEHLLASTATWVEGMNDIRAVGLGGSWARDRARMDSDADFVVLTNCKETYVQSARWVAKAVGDEAHIIWTRKWGPLTERRVILPSGFEIEYGFAPVSWASVDPLDAGTASVVSDGFCLVYDPDGLLARLVEAVEQTGQ